jgi:hypothetical protein
VADLSPPTPQAEYTTRLVCCTPRVRDLGATSIREFSMLGTAAHRVVQFAYHGGQGGGSGLALLAVFVGLIATAGWLIFSELEWRNTVLITLAGWAVGLALTFGL